MGKRKIIYILYIYIHGRKKAYDIYIYFVGESKERKKAMAAIEKTPAAAVAAATAAMANNNTSTNEVAFAKCECCGLTEECTGAYIKRVRDRFHGRWICGLCAEAVKDEVLRSERGRRRLIGNEEEALNRHMSFCKKFSSLRRPPPNSTEELISAVKQLLLRTLDSPRKENNNNDNSSSMLRSNSCFPALEG